MGTKAQKNTPEHDGWGVTVILPESVVKFLRRLEALPNGRYFLVVDKEAGVISSWSVQGESKVERA